MVSFQILVLISLSYLERSVLDNILGFNGCLFLDPLAFVSYHLWVIRRRFKVMFLFSSNHRFDSFESP